MESELNKTCKSYVNKNIARKCVICKTEIERGRKKTKQKKTLNF